jgi:uncharacterized protein (TIGR03118 family)
VVASATALGAPIAANAGGDPSAYKQINLVSDIPGVAEITDPHLVNPWGLAAFPGAPLWVADNGTNDSTLYTGGVRGSAPNIVPLVVKIPFGAPDGTVANSTGDFPVSSDRGTAPASFIFASETGAITAWSGSVSGTSATTEVKPGANKVYKGLALDSIGGANFLYATNFRAGTIDVFNGQFQRVDLPGGFVDPKLPKGYAPFGLQEENGDLYVTYAKQDAARHVVVAGPGHGFVDVYSAGGVLLKRLISRGALNSPWGIALAPGDFGAFSHDLLVGNFGDGAINAYDPNTGALLGHLSDPHGHQIFINGLWGLLFGNGTFGSERSLTFAAGIADESHGLLGEITPAG